MAIDIYVAVSSVYLSLSLFVSVCVLQERLAFIVERRHQLIRCITYPSSGLHAAFWLYGLRVAPFSLRHRRIPE